MNALIEGARFVCAGNAGLFKVVTACATRKTGLSNDCILLAIIRASDKIRICVSSNKVR
jgi:hypothetical protein